MSDNLTGFDIISVVQTKKPHHREDWLELPAPALPEPPIAVTVWRHEPSGINVISAVERVYDEPVDQGPEYHISITKRTSEVVERVDSNEARWVLQQFHCEEAEEDNHVPYGKARHFWRPVRDDLAGYVCRCVDEEPAIREDKGDFIWRPV